MEKSSISKVAATQLVMGTQISNLENEVKDLHIKFDKSDKITTKIYNLLASDEDMGTKGVVQQVQENTTFRKDFKSKVTLFGLIGGALSGVGLWIISLMYK